MTIQERKETYTRMLEAFTTDEHYTKETGFCQALVVQRLALGEHINTVPEDYPELLRQKPKGVDNQHYWWRVNPNSEGRDRRMEALRKAIKECNKQLKNG